MSKAVARPFWVMEDTSSYQERTTDGLNGTGRGGPISIRLYRVVGRTPELAAEATYLPRSEGRARSFKSSLAFDLLGRASARRGLVVVGSRVAQGHGLLSRLRARGHPFVAALPISD